ncbi:DUF4173 domain-containing protein [Zavarzinia sp.]|uniref:DUF4153 domain-containing protein n=1 Tax=Zavarzinia sp. TaxID=2027920 RepID=UPI003BB4EE0E|nr:DUF4173 domain-containing protein [Zavarzinia sp.]
MPIRHLFRTKAFLVLALVVAGDFLLHRWPGVYWGAFALLLVAALAFARPVVLRHRSARVALGLAALYALSLMEEFQFLGLLLCWAFLIAATLLPRMAGFDDALAWGFRVIGAVVTSPWAPLRNFILWLRAFDRRPSRALGRWLGILALPLVGGLIFIALFASANPLVEQGLAHLDPRLWFAAITGERLYDWGWLLILATALLRPQRWRLRRRRATRPALALPGVTVASVGASLVVFNLIFAVENGLDLAYLWSGAGLPEGVTLAAYAHRGAYPLIVTALLAGAFVVVTLRPGSATGNSVWLRRLVVLWTVQNLFLVASSVRRTLDYIDAYDMTEMRFAALLWMALVAFGLFLICWRLLAGRSTRWLINANALAAGIVVTICVFIVDPAVVVAEWNLARAVGTYNRDSNNVCDRLRVDWCYLSDLGSAALAPAIRLEQTTEAPDLRAEAAKLRDRLMAQLERHQSSERWSFRGARRLAAARALLGRD